MSGPVLRSVLNMHILSLEDAALRSLAGSLPFLPPHALRNAARILPAELIHRLLVSAECQNTLNSIIFEALLTPKVLALDLSNLCRSEQSWLDFAWLPFALQAAPHLQDLRLAFHRLPSTLTALVPSPLTSLRSLDLSACSGLTPSLFASIIASSPRLLRLDLSGCRISDDHLRALESIRAPTRTTTTTTTSPFATLSLSHPPRPASPNKRFRSRSNSIESDVKRPRFDSFGIVTPNPMRMTPPLTLDHPLRALNISGGSVTDEGVQIICALFRCLEELNLANVTSFDDISPILTRLPHLRSLTVDGCDFQQALNFLDAPSPSLPPLEEFFFSGTGLISFDLLCALSRCSRSLRKLTLRNKNFDFLDRHGRQIDPSFFIAPCFSLQDLDLFGVHLPQSFPSLIKPHMSSLITLDLTNCELAEDDLVDLFARPLPRLRSLTLSQPSNFELIAQIGKASPQLEHLELHINRGKVLTEESFVSLSQLLPNLLTVRLWSLASLSLDSCELALTTWTQLKSILIGVWKNGDLNLDAAEFLELQLHFPSIEIRCFCPGRIETAHVSLFCPSHLGHVTVNRIDIHLEVDDLGEGDVSIEPIVLIDNVPIWTNEAPVSLVHLSESISVPGARAMCTQWCCECDIDCFNGVLSHSLFDALGKEYIVWDIHDPGPKRRYVFEKDQYTKAINNARLAEVQLRYRTQLEAVVTRASSSFAALSPHLHGHGTSNQPQLQLQSHSPSPPQSPSHSDDDSMDWEETEDPTFKPFTEEEQALLRRQTTMFRNLF